MPSEVDLTFETLYRDNRDAVYAYVAGMLRDRSAAEDVTATAFERAYRKRRTQDPRRGTPRSWLFGIARNAALDELRRRRRHAELPHDPEDEEAAGRIEDHAEATLRRAALRDAMATLSEPERELIALKFFSQLSNGEIAEALGISEGNAAVRLHRTIRKLKEVYVAAA
jgi:RNA polymerase sigma-70 factor (ECF subfamily)